MTSDLRPKIYRSDEKQLSQEERDELTGAGFNEKSEWLYSDISGDRWYLQFKPFETGVQLYCPKRRILAKNDLTADYGSIWDPDHFRLVIIDAKTDDPVIGLPTRITIWNYNDDTTTSYDLKKITRSDLTTP